MTSITYIGIDVHSTNYTLCAFSLEGQKVFGRTTINPDIDELLKYLATLERFEIFRPDLRHTALQPLEIHKVFPAVCALSGTNMPRNLSKPSY